MKRFLLRAVALLSALTLPGTASSELPHLSPERWRADIRYAAVAIPMVHKNAFHSSPREAFDRKIAALLAQAEYSSDAEMVVGLQELAASIGDGHSFLSTHKILRTYPLDLKVIEGSVRVIRARAGLDSALGARVVAIDGTPINEARTRIRRLIPEAENAWFVRNKEAGLLVQAEDLSVLGIARGTAAATWTLEVHGRPFNLTVESLPPDTRVEWKALPGRPLSQSRPDQAFWFAELPGTRAVYVQFRGYADLEVNARRLLDFIDDRRARAVVFDMRWNGGGNFSLPRRFIIPQLRRRPELMKQGRIFVLAGRGTFSAGMTNAIDFKRQLNAILVGEPIGARPNGFQENGWIELPNSKLRLSVSTLRYTFWPKDTDAVRPDVLVEPRWDDFVAGRDPALDRVVKLLSAGDHKPG